MSRNFNNFVITKGLLNRNTSEQVLESLHDHVGHPARDRTTSLARERFYWPGYTTEIVNYVDHCPRCLMRKSSVVKAPMISIESRYPLDLVTTDFFKS